jgi:hypothetical protein
MSGKQWWKSFLDETKLFTLRLVILKYIWCWYSHSMEPEASYYDPSDSQTYLDALSIQEETGKIFVLLLLYIPNISY